MGGREGGKFIRFNKGRKGGGLLGQKEVDEEMRGANERVSLFDNCADMHSSFYDAVYYVC